MKTLKWVGFSLGIVALVAVLGFGIKHLLGLLADSLPKPVVPSGPSATGMIEFDEASGRLDTHKGKIAFGNTDEARKLAGEFARILKVGHKPLTEGVRTSRFQPTKGEYITHCELREGRCAFLVYVPDLRRLPKKNKELQAALAWGTAVTLLKDSGRPVGTKLGVGLRGLMLYGHVMTGQLPAEGKHGVQWSGQGHAGERKLYPFFRRRAKAGTQPARASRTAPGRVPRPRGS